MDWLVVLWLPVASKTQAKLVKLVDPHSSFFITWLNSSINVWDFLFTLLLWEKQLVYNVALVAVIQKRFPFCQHLLNGKNGPPFTFSFVFALCEHYSLELAS